MSTINDNHFLTDKGYSNYEDTMSIPRHRWYFYKEGFSPILVEKAIEAAGVQKDEVIIDPFNGGGTTTLTSSVLGYKSVGIEVNPFTSFLSQAKVKDVASEDISRWRNMIQKGSMKHRSSPLIGFSTFSRTSELDKWLFNDSVLTAFEGAWKEVQKIGSYDARKIMKLSLIASAMENCNARRDGKCMKYKTGWKQSAFDKYSFIESVNRNLDTIENDIFNTRIKRKPIIINGDSRSILSLNEPSLNFKLCITSPPYLNTFDYTDIYRPELFLGKFVQNNQQLYSLRLKTVRSHIQAKWSPPFFNDFGALYQQIIDHVNSNSNILMHKDIPMMIQAYFEDMFNILKNLRSKADKNAQLWFVVSNSAYADREVPVDLIVGDIGTKAGWFLKEINVLRYLKKRKTRYSPNVNSLRESVIVFTSSK